MFAPRGLSSKTDATAYNPKLVLRGPMKIAKGALFSIVAGGVLLFTGNPTLRAETVDHCQRRIVHAERELHEAILRHGRNSWRANHERRELHSARERCWRERQRWWDEHEHRWHTARDWNEHDHDND